VVPPWFAHPSRRSASTSAADENLIAVPHPTGHGQCLSSTTAMLRRYNGRARPRLLIPPCRPRFCRQHGLGWTFGRPLRGHVPRVSKAPALSLGQLSVARTQRVLIPVNAYVNMAAKDHFVLLTARLAHRPCIVNTHAPSTRPHPLAHTPRTHPHPQGACSGRHSRGCRSISFRRAIPPGLQRERLESHRIQG